MGYNVYAQNTVVTDDDSYTGNNSAVLDTYSKTKGLLAPRMTTSQRLAIPSPANGLLVYDETVNQYYVFSDNTWNPLDAPAIWQTSSDSVYVIGSGKRYGVGTASPIAKLTVQGDATIAADEPLFEVKNSAGDIIFAVYENEVKVNFKESVKGVKGGFAVGGLTGTKADPTEYLRITPDSVRVYIKDGAKGVKGGFAVGGLTGTKAGSEKYLTIERDSTRIYINDAAKGVKGGFAVGGLTSTKVGANFLDLTPANYFIGQGAGANMQPSDAPLQGKYNQFFGYESGFKNTDGLYNILIGYQSGFSGQTGNYNTFMGYQAGYNNTGSDNTFIGFKAGSSHLSRGGNVYIGSKAGELASNGEQNVFIGEQSGSHTTYGAANVFMGFQSGFNNTGHSMDPIYGSNNVYLGYQAGYTGTTLLKNVFIGYQAGYNSTPGGVWWYGSLNVFVGNEAGLSNTTGGQNVAIGDGALKGNTTGHWNIAIGEQAFVGANTGEQNIAMGKLSLQNNTTGSYNIALGGYALNANTTGSSNISLGGGLGANSTGNRNIGIGSAAGRSVSSTSGTVAIGSRAIWDATGAQNTAIGDSVFYNLRNGSNVTGVGSKILVSNVFGTYNNSTAIGNGTMITSSNQVRLGNTSVTSISGQVAWSTYSDKRIKENIKSDVPGLAFIKKLNPVTYNLNISEQRNLLGINNSNNLNDKTDIQKIKFSGFIAQEVEEAAKSIGYDFSGVDRSELKNGGLYALRYSEFTVPIVKAIQEQQEIIESLRLENKDLKTRIERLEKLISQ